MSPFALLILALGTIGHTVLWVALVNRIHAVGIKRKWVDAWTVVFGLMLIIFPLVVGAVVTGIVQTESTMPGRFVSQAVWCYVGACAVLALAAGVQRWLWYRHPERHSALLGNHTSFVSGMDNHGPLTAPGIPTWLSRIPGNEVLKPCVQEKQIAIPRLLCADEPLRIAHLTDLHMCGRITRSYFERVVEEVNALEPDLVAITGDILEREECFEWIPATLGRLQAKGGVYYILGNHDKYIDVGRLNAVLAESGLVHISGAYHPLTIRGISLILAGNEVPWFNPPTDLRNCPAHDGAGLPLRILLAHSPDQFGWARENDIDLMLAGHLHGGQVRFPLIGAVFSPSLHGVRYAAGIFTAGNTVMHVSRGTGSFSPFRYNCSPEIAMLTLRSVRDVCPDKER